MNFKWLKILVVIVVLFLVFSISFGCKTVATTTTAAAAETTSGEPIKLVFWWWGEQEAPGLEKFVNESIKMYEEKNPNI
ncbi:MAG: hypothetical protein M1479_05475, partial [Actinobacteria bacterium]|nr:hypothetical protein [Actinomycetota bacterium]